MLFIQFHKSIQFHSPAPDGRYYPGRDNYTQAAPGLELSWRFAVKRHWLFLTPVGFKYVAI